MDFLGRVESMEEDIKVVEQAISKSLCLSHSNQTSGSAGFRDSFTNSDMVDLVASIYAKDIAVFEYVFEG